MRLPLEMRITGGSSINLAPQFGNYHGTCSIEVLTPENVNKDEWIDYMQEISNAWLNLTHDDGEPIHPFKNEDGQSLYCRPHWAKEWMDLKVDGQSINTYLKEKAYKEQIPLFIEGIEAVAKSGGYTIDDANEMFSTKFSREFFSKDKTAA